LWRFFFSIAKKPENLIPLLFFAAPPIEILHNLPLLLCSIYSLAGQGCGKFQHELDVFFRKSFRIIFHAVDEGFLVKVITRVSHQEIVKTIIDVNNIG
jgi:hypothetical protein